MIHEMVAVEGFDEGEVGHRDPSLSVLETRGSNEMMPVIYYELGHRAFWKLASA